MNGEQETVNSEQSTVNGERATGHQLPATGHRPLVAALTLLALSLPAIYPLFSGSLPCSDDAAFHLLRLTQLDHLLRQGVCYSRWAPDMAQGYGFPFFNFYAPLSYYFAELTSLLVGNLNLGMRLAFALGFYLTGLTTYLLARDHFSRPAALVTAVAVIYAPYFAYDVYFRGNLAESLAWPLLPLALWAIGRLARTNDRRYLLVTAVSYAAILLTHNVFALIFSPLLALYGLWEIVNGQWSMVNGRRPPLTIDNWQLTIGNLLLSLLLGLGLAAFFWLPAIAERGLVHSDRLLVPPIFVYWGNFVTLAEIFTPPQTVYSDLINPSPARALGLVPLLLALPGLLFGWRRPHLRRTVIFFGATTAVYTFLMTAASEPLWANLPLIEYVQFPWRLLGPAALTLAMLIGASVDVLGSGGAGERRSRGAEEQGGGGAGERVSHLPISPSPHLPISLSPLLPISLSPLLPIFFTAALILSALPWLDARFCPGLADPTIADLQAFERDSATIGTTAKGEYLPRTVEYMPAEPATEPFAPLPETAVLLSATRAPLRLEAAIQASDPFTLTTNIFHYPGWRATLNGQPIPITPAPGTGLITLPIPIGDHTLAISFASTPLRTTANAVSWFSLFVLILFVIRKPYSVTRVPSFTIHNSQFTIHNSPPLSPAPLLLLGLFLFALIHFLLPRLDTPLRRAALPGMGETAVFTNHFILRDTQIARRAIPADGDLLITAHWQASQPVDRAYRDTVRLIGPDGNLWSEKTADFPRVFRAPGPTQSWPTDRFAESQHLLTPLPGAPPGLYQIELILFDQETLVNVPLTDGRLALDLGTVELTRPETAVSPPTQYPADFTWGDLRLTGYSLDRAAAAPGDPFLLTLAWRAESAPAADHTARLTLLAPDGRIAFQRDLPPIRADFPTSEWEAGDWWRAQHSFRLPVGLESGLHRWQLALCPGDCAGTEPTTDLGDLTITAPDRLFTAPPLATPLNAPFADLATLLGLTLSPAPPPPGPLSLRLAWRAERETPTSYRVFVHLVDQTGQIVAQSDGEPAGWSRPTTGWLPGEIILDEHTLDLGNAPAGAYELRIGLYDPLGGGRVPLTDGETAVSLPITLP